MVPDTGTQDVSRRRTKSVIVIMEFESIEATCIMSTNVICTVGYREG